MNEEVVKIKRYLPDAFGGRTEKKQQQSSLPADLSPGSELSVRHIQPDIRLGGNPIKIKIQLFHRDPV